MDIRTKSATLIEKASKLSDRIDLQGSDVDSTFYQENCAQCPANDDIVYNIGNNRHQLYCALQASLLGGDVTEAARISAQVKDSFGRDPDCPPSYGGKSMREFERMLEETEAI